MALRNCLVRFIYRIRIDVKELFYGSSNGWREFWVWENLSASKNNFSISIFLKKTSENK